MFTREPGRGGLAGRLGVLALVTAFAACSGETTTDHGGNAALYACQRNPDCTAVPASCCGSCGAPTRGDAVAVNVGEQAAFRHSACGAGTGCPACAPLFVDPTLVATCRSAHCEIVDLHEHAMTACTKDADCRIRVADCCECGGDTGIGRLIGLNVAAENDYTALVCNASQACDECAPLYPPEVTVACNGAGFCQTHDARLP
jgi:hypothetical protein